MQIHLFNLDFGTMRAFTSIWYTMVNIVHSCSNCFVFFNTIKFETRKSRCFEFTEEIYIHVSIRIIVDSRQPGTQNKETIHLYSYHILNILDPYIELLAKFKATWLYQIYCLICYYFRFLRTPTPSSIFFLALRIYVHCTCIVAFFQFLN